MPEVTEVSFNTTVEIDLNGQPEEVTAHVRVVKTVKDGRQEQEVTLRDDEGKDIDFDKLSEPEQQELVDQIGMQFDAAMNGRGSVTDCAEGAD